MKYSLCDVAPSFNYQLKGRLLREKPIIFEFALRSVEFVPIFKVNYIGESVRNGLIIQFLYLSKFLKIAQKISQIP